MLPTLRAGFPVSHILTKKITHKSAQWLTFQWIGDTVKLIIKINYQMMQKSVFGTWHGPGFDELSEAMVTHTRSAHV